MAHSSLTWKLAVSCLLIAVVLASVYVRAPRGVTPPAELRRLVFSALAVYCTGVLASLTHHRVMAGVLYAAGIAMCALASWLSRGIDSGGPPDDDEPADGDPPPDPGGLAPVDWKAFERSLADYSARQPAGLRR